MVTFGERWLWWVRPRYESRLPTRVPETAEEVHGVRVWHALNELARGAAATGDSDVLDALELIRSRERDSVQHYLCLRLGRPPTPTELHLVVALSAGLRVELAAQPPSLSAEDALGILEQVVASLEL